MGRPAKHSNVPDARERIVSSFWTLLKRHRLNEITVGMIVAEAGCNRNTFYYHFDNKEALVNSILDEELKDTAQRVFNMVAGFEDDYLKSLFSEGYLGRVALLMNKGNADLIGGKVKQHVAGVWQAVLRPEGKDLSDQTHCVIECMTGSILSLISYLGNEAIAGTPKDAPFEFLRSMSDRAVSYICMYEDVDKTEVLMRLQMVERYSKIPQM